MAGTSKQRKAAHARRVELAQLLVVATALDWETLTQQVRASEPHAVQKLVTASRACERLRDAVQKLRALRREVP